MKLWHAIIILILIFGTMYVLAEQDFRLPTVDIKITPHKDGIPTGWSNEELRSWYAGYNESLFYGQLPKDTIVAWDDLSFAKAMGLTEKIADGRFLIRIDKNMNRADVTITETLLHEMCHVEDSYVENDEDDSDRHGPKWTGCMVRLAVHGGFSGIW